MKRIVHILTMCVALFLCSCNNTTQPPQRTDKYSLDSLMCLANKNLNAASLRIVEGEQNGELTPYEVAYSRANITYQYAGNKPVAMDYCRQALSYLTEDDYVLQVQALYLLATIADVDNDSYSCINACKEGKKITHRHNMKFMMHAFEFLNGKCNLYMGFQDEAFKMMSSAVDKAVKVVELENEYEILISYVNTLISSYMAVDDMKNVVRESKILSMLTDELETKYPENKNYYVRRKIETPANQPNNTLLIISALFVFVIIIIAAFVIIYRINRRKMSDSTEKLEQIQQQMQLIANENNITVKKDVKTPKTLSSLVEGEKLYLNKDLSRVQVIKMLGCSHKTLTKMLNNIQPDLSFPDYIKGLRVEHAINMIKENPYLNVKEVCDQSGFYSISSFERSFKSITGKTPKEYMKSLSN